MVLVRHKSMIALIFIITAALGLTRALLTPHTYTYSTSIEIGSQIINGTVMPFESPETLQAKLDYSFISNILNQYRLSNPENVQSYKINTSVPNNSEIIVLETKGTEDQKDVINNLLRNSTKKAIKDHSRIYEAVKQNIIASKNQTTIELALLEEKKPEQTDKVQLLKNRIESYNSQLANLRNTREILPPMKSIDATGVGKKVIVIATAFIGVLLGVFAAFITEFITKVREINSQ